MAYKSDGGPKGGQTAKDKKAGDVGAKGGIGGGKQGGSGNSGGLGGGLPSGAFSRPAPRTSQLASQAAAIGGLNPKANNRAAQVDSFFSGATGYNKTDFSKAVKDYQDQGGWNKALDFFTGVHEVNPINAWNGTPNASWGFDPLGAALGVAGLATGMPIGTAYGIGKKLTGWSGPEMAFSGSPTSYSGYKAPGGYSPFGGHSSPGGTGNNQWASKPQTSPQPLQTQTQQAPASSSLPNTPKFPGFPDYGSYTPFGKSNWSWG